MVGRGIVTVRCLNFLLLKEIIILLDLLIIYIDADVVAAILTGNSTKTAALSSCHIKHFLMAYCEVCQVEATGNCSVCVCVYSSRFHINCMTIKYPLLFADCLYVLQDTEMSTYALCLKVRYRERE